jgi:hypothetical protein
MQREGVMIVKCPECGGNVSDRAKTCPHCGYELALASGKYVKCDCCGATVEASAVGPSPGGGYKKVCPRCYNELSDWRESQGPNFY